MLAMFKHLEGTFIGLHLYSMKMHGYGYKLRFTLSHSLIIMLFSIFVFSAFVIAAPLDLPLDIANFRNLTATDRCSDSPGWQAPDFLAEDCFVAIQRVYIEKVLQKPNELYEFYARGSYPTTKKPSVRTPVKYTVGR